MQLDADSETTQTAETNRAYDRALRFLGFRPRSRWEMMRYLSQKGFSVDICTDVLDRLTAAGLVDDTEFVSYWISNREQFSPRGRRALAQELRAKGIERGLIESGLGDEPAELAIAVRAASRKVRAYSGQDGNEAKRRLIGYLIRRGFSYRDAEEAATVALSRAESDAVSPDDSPERV